MKKPPSQRPERQGPMHLYAVGQPYDPRQRSWPEALITISGPAAMNFGSSLGTPPRAKSLRCEPAGSSSG